MACDNCLDNEFYQDKAEHYLQTYGIPINVSKQILKILYTSLDSCGLDCCDNIYSGQLALMQFQNEGTNLTQSSNVGIMNFVGAGVTASISGNVLTISISGGGGSSGLANGNYGDITVSNGTLTWTINNGVISTAKLADGAVTNNKLAVNSVTDTKIQNGAVSNAKLANNSVSNSKIQDGSITANKLAQMGATVGQVLKWNGSAWIASDDLTLGGGAVTQGANVGSGQGEIYRDTTGNTINFKKLNAAGNISIINNTDDITISTTSVGEANTASNLGVSGKSIFAQKVGVDLQLRRLVAGTNIVLTENANDITIDATISGSGAPTDASYVTLSTNTGLSNERVLTQGTGILITDGGANGPITISATGGLATAWDLSGNAGTVAGTNFIGTTDNVDVVFKRNNGIAGRLGLNSVSFGVNSLLNNTTGDQNTANGAAALGSNTTGNGNTANGHFTLFSNTTGTNNTALGREALSSNTTVSNLVAVGYRALYSNTTGIFNTAVGYYALNANTIGNYNTATGKSSLASNTQGINNTANGKSALQDNTTGSANTANGANALILNISGEFNTANGAYALYSNTTGNSNTSNGYLALNSNENGSNNTAIGRSALTSNVSGNDNTALGLNADVAGAAQSFSTVIGSGAIVSTDNTVKLGRSTEDSVVIGQNGAVSSAKLAVASTTKGFLPPVMTTANRDSISSPTRGLMIYDSSVDKVSVYNGTIWKYLAYE